MIAELRQEFNQRYTEEAYRLFLRKLHARCGVSVDFRVAETPVFLQKSMLDRMATLGASMATTLLNWPEYRVAAQSAIPAEFLVAGKSDHPNFLTADFALIRTSNLESAQEFEPRLVEIQAFPSVFGYQSVLNEVYAEAYGLSADLGVYLGGLTGSSYWDLLRKTIVGDFAPENVILMEIDPLHQKTLPDFAVTQRQLGIAVVDIQTLVPVGKKLHYRNERGELTPVHRIYNRAIADEMVARKITLPFDLNGDWDVEWAGHPNWYFLVSKFSVPWLSKLRAIEGGIATYVPPAVFLNDFLAGNGASELAAAGVELAGGKGSQQVYENLLLKPLFSFAGRGISFSPSRSELLSIPEQDRKNYLLQQRMHFASTIETPEGLTQAEIRILYMWPEGGELTPAISLVRLGRGKMMGVDHNRNQAWVGSSAAFWRS